MGLRTRIGKVSLPDSTCLSFGVLDVVDLGVRELMASVQEPENQWCEGRQLVDLESRNVSPSVVHFGSCRYLRMHLGSAVLTADENFLGLSPL